MSYDGQDDLDFTEVDDFFAEGAEEFNPDKDIPSNAPIPDGKYQVRIESVKFKRSKTGKVMLKWQFEIHTGDYARRKLFHQNMIQSKDNAKWLVKDLYICGMENVDPTLGVKGVEARLDELLDKFVEVALKTQKEKNKEGEPQQTTYINKRIGVGSTAKSAKTESPDGQSDITDFEHDMDLPPDGMSY